MNKTTTTKKNDSVWIFHGFHISNTMQSKRIIFTWFTYIQMKTAHFLVLHFIDCLFVANTIAILKMNSFIKSGINVTRWHKTQQEFHFFFFFWILHIAIFTYAASYSIYSWFIILCLFFHENRTNKKCPEVIWVLH